MQQCRVLMSAVERAWVVPYIGIMVFEVGMSDPLSLLFVMANTKQLCWF